MALLKMKFALGEHMIIGIQRGNYPLVGRGKKFGWGDSTWRDFFLMDMEEVMSKFLATNGGVSPHPNPVRKTLDFVYKTLQANMTGPYEQKMRNC